MDRQFAIATLILRDVDRAQDAVQEALVSAWRDVRALRDPEAWDAWLHRLTVRACYRLATSQRRRDLVEVRVVPDPTPDRVTDFTTSVAERDRMEREMGRLSLDQRAVLVLHFHADLTLEQVADVLGIPIGTAKSRLHYALQALRGTMRDRAMLPARPIGERTA